MIKMIESVGATHSPRVTRKCTHLITTKLDVKVESRQVKAARNVYTCEIVSPDWLVMSVAAGKPLPEKDYSMRPPAPPNVNQKPGQATAGMKRLLDEAIEGSLETQNKRVRMEMVSVSRKGAAPASGIQNEDGFSTYVDRSGEVWDAMLVRCTSGGKSNCFYRLRLLVNRYGTGFRCEACWGRVGAAAVWLRESEKSQLDPMEDFRRRFRAKTGIHWCQKAVVKPIPGKYRYNGPGHGNMVKMAQPKCSLSEDVQRVLGLIFQKTVLSTTSSTLYDARKLPIGRLSKDTLLEGYNALQSLSDLIQSPLLSRSKYWTSFETATAKLSSEYLSIIPHRFGQNKPPVLCTPQHIQKELELLDELANVAIAAQSVDFSKSVNFHHLDLQFKALSLDEMTPLQHRSLESTSLTAYFHQSASPNEFKVTDIFRIQRNGEENQPKTAMQLLFHGSNRRLLWHGSRSTNFAGILTRGLQMRPEGVQLNGASYGEGIYFADAASTSIHFTSVHRSHKTGLLLLCDVELDVSEFWAGNPARSGALSRQVKQHASLEVWTSGGWIHSSLERTRLPVQSQAGQYASQYVVYDSCQIRLKYLVVIQRNDY
ncbi:poly polymerase catalytic domain-containing protein [Aspergillus californicus]